MTYFRRPSFSKSKAKHFHPSTGILYSYYKISSTSPRPTLKWSTWPCGDCRRLNEATTDDRYPLPHTQNFNSCLAGSCIFSKIDLIRGYHQIPMVTGSIPKTAIATPFGLWKLLRMPYALKNAAQTFQRLKDGILQDLDFAFVFRNFLGGKHKRNFHSLLQNSTQYLLKLCCNNMPGGKVTRLPLIRFLCFLIMIFSLKKGEHLFQIHMLVNSFATETYVIRVLVSSQPFKKIVAVSLCTLQNSDCEEQ